MIYEPETVKGFQDFLPPLSQKRAGVKRIIEEYYSRYGFLPVETPTIEFDEFMRGDSLENEDEAVSDRFRLKDRGGRALGLRYEFTFQLARILKQNPTIRLPFRRYQIGNIFRDEPTGPGRYREFVQCDADIIGESSIESDAECLSLCSDILRALNVNATIYVNNRRLLNSILDSVKIADKKAVMRELDKLDKVGEDDVKSSLKKYADTGQILTLFKLLEKDLAFFLKNIFEGADDIEKLKLLGKKYGFNFEFSPFMMRGFAYYTGNIFEVKTKEKKETICSGGRYDGVVGKYLGVPIPAVGISFGLERVAELANIKFSGVKVGVISIEKDDAARKLTQKLRNNGLSSLFLSGKVGKSLEYVNAEGIPASVFIGETEIKEKKYKLKIMSSGEEKMLTLPQLLKALREL